MRIFRFGFPLFLFMLMPLSSSSLFAHFIWITAGPQSSDGKVHVYFSDAASPDDPDLLDKIADVTVWQCNQDGKPVALKTIKGSDSLIGEKQDGNGSVFVLTRDYGVISRGGDTFLLKYHAKCQPLSNTTSWRVVGDVERQPLEVAANQQNDKTVFTVLWQGKPLANSLVTVVAPGIETKLEGDTDNEGKVSFELKTHGLFSIRAKQTETGSGERDGKNYTSIRHYATLSLSIGQPTPTASVAPEVRASALPGLETGLTSFGAALIDNSVYLYGGHYGKPHHYSREGQSDRLLRLNLKQLSGWEVIANGPRRTGLTAVAHAGKFYRIGGFEARNSESEKQVLYSMPDFARFDPATNQWTELTPMPAGRSSHDAVVVGNTLYVIGGWDLQGEGQSKWHDTAYSVDLSANEIAWKELPKPPHQRRALSLGEWQGKIYAIGGMQPEGGPTTQTMVFDPKSGTWSDGPKLNGEPMEGFGSSAFLCNGTLCVTTFAGNLQSLSKDGTQWTNSAKLAYPRFFHRMLPINGDEVVIVGGASMQAGKIRELEIVPVVAKTNANGD